jgi:hypothetical protein
MSRQAIAVWGFVLALGAAGTAAAQQEPQRGKVNVFLRGGVGNYTGELGENFEVGPSWGLTLNVQPLRFLGFELGYEGARNTGKTVLFDHALVRHGATGLIKLSLPFELVRPFVGGGLGISRISASGDFEGAFGSDMVEEVPVALGIEFNTGRLTAGARATYRLLLGEDFSEQAENPQGGFFDVTLTLGARF